jgi:hypothetical protein
LTDSLPLVWQPGEKDRITVVGAVGTGKSFWARNYCKRIYRNITSDMYNDSDDLGVVIPLRDFIDRAADGDFSTGSLRLVIETDFSMSLADNQEMIIEACLDDIGNVNLYLEESGIVLEGSSTKAPPALNRLGAGGRHDQVSFIISGQRYHSQFPPIIRAGASRLIVFRQIEPEDIRDLKQRMGKSQRIDMRAAGYAADMPVDEAILILPDYWFIDYSPRDGARLCAPI